MTPELIRFLWTVAPSIFVGIVMAWYTMKQNKREKKVEKRAEMRKKESLLTLKMTFANGKLAHATAVAYKNGKMNGELEDAERAYNDAVKAYNKFLNETHADLMEED